MTTERLLKFLAFPLLVAIALAGPSSGQDQMSLLALKLDLQQRYKLDFVHLEEVSGGALTGLFTLAGEFTPDADMLKPSGEPVDPREVARRFLSQEAGLFSLEGDSADLRLLRIFNDERGAAHLVYRRWLGEVLLDGMEIRFHVDSAGQLYAVDGKNVPLTFAEQEVIASRLAECRLDKQDITNLVLQDLEAQGVSRELLKLHEVERVAIPSSPYVIWKVDVVAVPGNGRWLYRIDASTGEILETVDALESADGGKPSPLRQFHSTEPLSPVLPLTIEIDKEALASSGNPSLRIKETPPAIVTEGFKHETPDSVTGLRSIAKNRDYASGEEAKAKREVE